MNWPNDIHNKRARIGTAIFMTLLLLFIFFFGLTYLNPPPNSGPVINFGFDEQGAGETASSEQVDEPVQEQQQEVTPPPTESTPVVTDEVTTQDVEEAAVVEKKEDPKPPVEQPKEVKDPPKEDPKPSNDLMDRLNKTKNQQDASKNDGNKSGEGVTSGSGDQGKETGDRKSQSREGQGGPGDGNYRLGGRNALNKVKPPYDCPEEGRVVVKVYVDRSGKVVRAVPGEAIDNGPASTTSASCLYNEAKNAALKTTWQPDPKAKEQQMGYIVYNFVKGN
jgi:protein TonB